MSTEMSDDTAVSQLLECGFAVPVLAQAGGMDVGTIALIVVAVLVLFAIFFFMFRTKEEPKKPEISERDSAEAPTKDVLEDRIEVEEPVEITDDMSLAEIKRIKSARVKKKKSKGKRRETAVDATERARRELEDDEEAEESADDAEAVEETEEAEAAEEVVTAEAEEAEEAEEEDVTSADLDEVAEAAEDAEAGKTTSKSGAFKIPRPSTGKKKPLEAKSKLPKPGAKKDKEKLEPSEAEEAETLESSETEDAEALPSPEEEDAGTLEPPEGEEAEKLPPAEEEEAEELEPGEAEGAEALEPPQGEEPEEPRAAEEAEKAEEKKPKSLEEGLEKTRSGFIDKLSSIFSGDELDEDTLEDIEEVLFTADIGPYVAQDIIDSVEEDLSGDEKQDPGKIWSHIRTYTEDLLREHEAPLEVDSAKPFVILVVGVNGVGKTTTIGKMASKFRQAGKSVLLVAGDTFRAGAVDQLGIWADRADFPIHEGEDQADPSSVVYDGIKRGVEEDVDVVLCDTSGRLHTNPNLMDELAKMGRVAGKAREGAPHETILVLDANTGQNAIAQAEKFAEVLDISGLALTKLDGTAKGGVILGICRRLEAPVRYIGIGEDIEDLREFNAEEFVEALFM